MDEFGQRMFQVESSTNEAIRVANEALTRVGILEKANENKFDQIIDQMGELKASLAKLFDRFWWVAVAVIGMLLAVSAYLYVENDKINKQFMTQLINNNHDTK